jgi:hypothetical protein
MANFFRRGGSCQSYCYSNTRVHGTRVVLLRDHHVSRLPARRIVLRTSAYTQVRLNEANPIPSEQIRSPLPFAFTIHRNDKPSRHISQTGTGTSRYTTILLDVPRDNANPNSPPISNPVALDRIRLFAISRRSIVLGSFQRLPLSSPYSSPYK